MGTLERRAAYRKGNDAEARAAALLVAAGYEILNRRYRTPAGEIDLVARRDDIIRFVEVKARRNISDAAWAISERQQRRIASAAEYWLQSFPQPQADTMTFDAMLVSPGCPVQHLVDAFRG